MRTATLKNFAKLFVRQILNTKGKISAVLSKISTGITPKLKNPVPSAAPKRPLARQGRRLDSANA